MLPLPALACPPLVGCSGLLGGSPPSGGRGTDLGKCVERVITAGPQVRGAMQSIPRGSAGSLKQDFEFACVRFTSGLDRQAANLRRR
jgi:hypothetical protein